MHRLTARLLLTLMLVGMFAPVALAISAPAPHACCMRKPMHDHGQPGSEFHSPASHCQHDCCHALAGFRSAQLKPASVGSVTPASSHLTRQADPILRSSRECSSRSVRAPPQFSIA
jgi:hypothetical protein